MQILLVDDSRLMRRYVARTLEMTGMEIVIGEAANGLDALEQARAARPDLIITDLNMPEMNGEELIARVAGDPDLRGIPVMILSADHSVRRLEKLIYQGAVAYMTKPVTPEDLRNRLLELVGDRA